MTFHKDNPRHAETVLTNETTDDTPWKHRWEREFRNTRWREHNGLFYPIGYEIARRRPATYANRNNR